MILLVDLIDFDNFKVENSKMVFGKLIIKIHFFVFQQWNSLFSNCLNQSQFFCICLHKIVSWFERQSINQIFLWDYYFHLYIRLNYLIKIYFKPLNLPNFLINSRNHWVVFKEFMLMIYKHQDQLKCFVFSRSTY